LPENLRHQRGCSSTSVAITGCGSDMRAKHGGILEEWAVIARRCSSEDLLEIGHDSEKSRKSALCGKSARKKAKKLKNSFLCVKKALTSVRVGVAS
jgi:hypothetical protein